ncbi:MAG: hypothetical protein GDA56_19150 [Hormoscilla sp. GM7CHS1pb]|nr:hypothetical protein [Hormoscilla sp. GM7CHS1pb]
MIQIICASDGKHSRSPIDDVSGDQGMGVGAAVGVMYNFTAVAMVAQQQMGYA